VWQRVQDAGEQAYDRSAACEFTSLIAYEWSGVRKLANMHRNVIFRTRDVPAAPTSHFEAPTAFELWSRLQSECREGLPGCDVLAIPHNSNWSNGNLFIPETPEGSDPAAVAQLRAELEPLLEVYQHKGDSECMNGISGLGEPDELCDFEKLRTGAVDRLRRRRSAATGSSRAAASRGSTSCAASCSRACRRRRSSASTRTASA
jgi:hypothetical protein